MGVATMLLPFNVMALPFKAMAFPFVGRSQLKKCLAALGAPDVGLLATWPWPGAAAGHSIKWERHDIKWEFHNLGNAGVGWSGVEAEGRHIRRGCGGL